MAYNAKGPHLLLMVMSRVAEMRHASMPHLPLAWQKSKTQHGADSDACTVLAYLLYGEGSSAGPVGTPALLCIRLLLLGDLQLGPAKTPDHPWCHPSATPCSKS